jgi:tetratricopeptide (TPR) repeat protein
MELIFLLLTIIGVIIALIFGYLQVIVPFVKKEVKFSKKFPFLISTESAVTVKIDKQTYTKQIEQAFPIPENRLPIAVMPFKNQTGDSSFDYLSEAIPNLLITNLEQSKYLSVMTWERMQDLLEVLGKEELKTIDDKLGFELCKLDGVNNIVLGSFTKAGELFATDLKILDVSSKQLLKTTKSKGKGIDSILELQIDELSKDISLGIGLSERKIETEQLKITDVTTNSKEAYNYFLKGRDDFGKFCLDSAEKYLKKAIEIDPTFAMAYFYLARNYMMLTNRNLSKENYEKAKMFSAKATDKEKLYIEAYYAGWVKQDSEKQFRIFKQIAEQYPREKRIHYSLGWYYYERQMYDKAIEEHSKACTLDPNYGSALNALSINYVLIGDFEKALEYITKYASVFSKDADPFDTMAWIYVQMGEIDTAITKYKKAIEIQPNFYFSYAGIAHCHALRENYHEAIQWIERLIDNAPSIGKKAEGYWWLGLYFYLLGKFDNALTQLQKAAEIMKQEGCQHHEARIYNIIGWIHYEKEDYELSCEYYDNYYATFKEYNPKNTARYRATYNFYTGLIDLKQNRIDIVKEKMDKIKNSLNEIKEAWHKERIMFYYELLSSEILLAQDSTVKAIVKYESAVQHFKTGISMLIENAMDYNLQPRRDFLARAYFKKGDIDKAILEYKKLITFDPKSKDRHLIHHLIHPRYHYELAKLYEEKGLKSKAIEQYEKFLDIWENADADRPELIDAKKRLASLQKSP